MLKAVIYDMDGVIVDSEPLHRKAYQKMFDDLVLKYQTNYIGHLLDSQLKPSAKHNVIYLISKIKLSY